MSNKATFKMSMREITEEVDLSDFGYGNREWNELTSDEQFAVVDDVTNNAVSEYLSYDIIVE